MAAFGHHARSFGSAFGHQRLRPLEYQLLARFASDLKPGSTLPEIGTGFNEKGNPSLFRNTNATKAFTDQQPGLTGTRALVRLAGFVNFDMSLAKSFTMPWKESHRIQLRGEAFNVFNHVNFFNPSLALSAPATFGEYRDASAPRVMQFALRYEF